jgi:hypothetical protein
MPDARALITFVAAVLLLLPSLAHADGELKVYELKDGSVIVGEVIDEGETAYLVKTPDGENVRVAYDQVERVTVLGATTTQPDVATVPPIGHIAPPAPPVPTALDHARAREVTSRALGMVGAISFGVGVGCSIGAGIWSIAGPTRTDFTPAITLNGAGIAGMGTSIGFMSGSMRVAMDSYSLLFEDMDTAATGAFGTGITFSIIGLSLATASSIGAMEHMPSYPPSWVIATAVSGGISLIVGHILSQAAVARLLDACADRLDSELAAKSGRTHPSISAWLAPSHRGMSGGFAMRF